MLQPIKATQATQATNATEATESSASLTPISEQRPGQTLKDRLMEPVDSTSAKTTSKASTLKSTSQYQAYSVAKYLPATTIASSKVATTSQAGDSSASTDGTYSSFLNNYTNWNDYWTALGAFQKQTSNDKVYVHDKYGEGFISADAKPYVDKYGLSKGIAYLESLAKADKLQADRQNPFYQPIMLDTSKMDTYYSDQESLSTGAYNKTGESGDKKSYSAAGILGDNQFTLTSDEIEKIKSIAETNGLGQAGFSDLLDKAYKAKYSYAANSFLPTVEGILNSPETSDWSSVVGKMHLPIDFHISDLDELADGFQSMFANPTGLNIAVGQASSQMSADLADELGLADKLKEMTSPATQWIDEKLGSGASETIANWAGAGMAVYGLAQQMAAQKKAAKWEEAYFTPIKNGKLCTSINDYSGSEKNNLKEIASEMGISADTLVKAFASLQVTSLYNTASQINSISQSYADSSKTDTATTFGGDGLSLSGSFI